MAKTPTVHNPTHFNPADYEITDYLDNKRPEYFGQGIDAYEEELAFWKADMERLLGAGWQAKKNHCCHCGNGRVRWITAVLHAPTGETVVFGADCTERLGFANRKDWKLAQLKAKAEAGHQRLKVWKQREAFLVANPALQAALVQMKNKVHERNTFVQDVMNKLNRYGSLSVNQVEGVLKSLARDIEFAARKTAEATEVKGDAPEGRQTVSGTVLTVKVVEGDYGTQLKMLLKLSNNARVWLTVPAAATSDDHGNHRDIRGGQITVTATFTRSKDDRSFAFGKRPHLVNVTPVAA